MTTPSDFPILDRVNSPEALRQLAHQELQTLAEEVRAFLIEVTSETGGHLAPGLGAVELTVALHYVFDTPKDRLVWDIGHQAYPHKILTGRRDEMRTIRKAGGLSGFLKRAESEYDSFGAGHSSTSISAALGMAVAARLHEDDREVVAIIGDGALTAGQAMEALYNAGDMDADLLVVLNDNEMSISRNVGAYVELSRPHPLRKGVYQRARRQQNRAGNRSARPGVCPTMGRAPQRNGDAEYAV